MSACLCLFPKKLDTHPKILYIRYINFCYVSIVSCLVLKYVDTKKGVVMDTHNRGIGKVIRSAVNKISTTSVNQFRMDVNKFSTTVNSFRKV